MIANMVDPAATRMSFELEGILGRLQNDRVLTSVELFTLGAALYARRRRRVALEPLMLKAFRTPRGRSLLFNAALELTASDRIQLSPTKRRCQ